MLLSQFTLLTNPLETGWQLSTVRPNSFELNARSYSILVYMFFNFLWHFIEMYAVQMSISIRNPSTFGENKPSISFIFKELLKEGKQGTLVSIANVVFI